MTTTARITYQWADRNSIGEPLPIVRYKRATSLATPSDEAKPYVHSSLLTENALTRSDAFKIAFLFAFSSAVACLAVVGLVDVLQKIGGWIYG